jgi:AmmeMemoRadiSam system protein B
MSYPKLRSIDVRPFEDRGRPLLLVRDPLGLSDLTVVMPRALAPLLPLLDGSRDASALRAALLVRGGLNVSEDTIQQLLDHLDNALLLDNARYEQARADAVRDFRAAEFRRPVLAGSGYPSDAEELRQRLDAYLAAVPSDDLNTDGQEAVVGLVSPHIDYQRGGPVYARVWGTAADAVRSADLAIVFGTDHNANHSLITLTRQNYATPYGVLPTPGPIVDLLAASIGEEAVFAEEINHQREHSIELAVTWLHHMRGGRPCQVLPILCGSFHHFIEQQSSPADHPVLNAVLATLRPIVADRRVVVVAAADLAHIGPAFGDPFPIDYVRYLRLEAADELLIQTILKGDAEVFYRTIAREENRRNVCGVPPIYLALHLLGPGAVGQMTGYDRCQADAQNTSFVSICGVIFRERNSH